MKTFFKYDFVNETIVGTKSAIRRANEGNTPEYAELCEKLRNQPTFKVVEKKIRENAKKQKHNGLTLNRMKEYIKLMPDADALLEEFEAQIKVADVLGAKYPLMKKWFFEHFPKYKEYIVSDEGEENVEKKETKHESNAVVSLAK